MTTNLLAWWHRRILRHPQTFVMNGVTEAGVWCYCDGYDAWLAERLYMTTPGVTARRRWFASDGGHGK